MAHAAWGSPAVLWASGLWTWDGSHNPALTSDEGILTASVSAPTLLSGVTSGSLASTVRGD